MDHDERFQINENARRESAEILFPTGRAISCENCYKPMDEEVILNWHTILCGSPMIIKLAFCPDCIPEVIGYRYRIRNVAEMTKELVAAVDKANAQKVWEQEHDKLPGRVKHI